MSLRLQILSEIFTICRLDASAALPARILNDPFFSITRTHDELSIVCAQSSIEPDTFPGITCEPNWRGLKVVGPLDFSLVGILAGLANILTEAKISLFALSTYETDYILVREPDFSAAVAALRAAGYQIEG